MRILARPWVFSWAGAVLVWAVLAAQAGPVAGAEVLSAALTFAAFFVLVGIGQMFVITLGPGNVDLSIPACMVLGGTLAMKLMDERAGWIAAGLGVAVLTGLAVGAANFALIRLLRIPPIIATLSSSFVVLSTAIWSNRGLRIKPPPPLADLAVAKIGGVPVVFLVVLALTLLAHVALHHTLWGRAVTAIGQNPRAAALAGIRVERVRFATYLLSALLAALCGFLVSAFSGGAALNMGEEYLLMSIAVVVIGGTSVAGGLANLPGLWGAALFTFLLVSLLNTFALSAGIRLILTGVIIILVIAVAGGRRRA